MIELNKLIDKFNELLKKGNSFEIETGNKKILISAPHAVEQTRNGKIKFAEPQTAIIALALNLYGYPCMIKTKNENDDANYDLKSTYKSTLLEYVKQNDIQFVIDLHQLHQKREMDICVSTGDDNHKNLLKYKNNANKIMNGFKPKNYLVTLNNPFYASKQNTISGFLSTNNIPSIQLEINSKILYDYNQDKYNELINTILKVLNILEKETNYEDSPSKQC